jgi:hypothetical protein
MSNEPRSQAEISESIMNEASAELAFNTGDYPREVKDAADDYRAAVSDVLSAGRQLERDLGELDAKRDLIPVSGAERLRREAVQEAQARAREADREADQAYARLEESLIEAALPTLDPSREQLARGELQLAVGNAEGFQLTSRAMRVATEGSADAVAALLQGTWGKTLFGVREVPNADAELKRLRRLAASNTNKQNGRQMLAASALPRVGKLSAAKTAAHLHLSDVAGLRRG